MRSFGIATVSSLRAAVVYVFVYLSPISIVPTIFFCAPQHVNQNNLSNFSSFLFSVHYYFRTLLEPHDPFRTFPTSVIQNHIKMTFYPRSARRFLLVTAFAFARNLSTSFVAAAAESVPWRDDVNWDELTSKLSPLAALIDTSFKNYRDECVPEFYVENPSNHALIDQPSGMCLPHLAYGWEAGNWMSPFNPLKPLDTVMGFEGDDDDTTPSLFVGDESARSLNLPYKVVFPANASDVLYIIEFAKKHKIEISVKNSGHSYSGASSKKDTLLINMNRFTHYAPGGITECVAALLGTAVADDLSNQACLLALARGKPGVIRVGGGENYGKSSTVNRFLDCFSHIMGIT